MPAESSPGYRRRALVVQLGFWASWMVGAALAALLTGPLSELGAELPYPTELWLEAYRGAFRFPYVAVPALTAALAWAHRTVERRCGERYAVPWALLLSGTLLGTCLIASYLPFASTCELAEDPSSGPVDSPVQACGGAGLKDYVEACTGAARAAFRPALSPAPGPAGGRTPPGRG